MAREPDRERDRGGRGSDSGEGAGSVRQGAPSAQNGEDRIAAIPRDPESVFLYWNLGGPRSAEVAREIGPGCQWVLRVLNLSEGTSTSIPIEPEAGNHYLRVRPGRTYGFELAAKAAGKWRTMCRTERVQMPPARPARADMDRPPEETPAGAATVRLNRTHAAARGMGVPGLDLESTPLALGSSPRGSSRARR